MTGIDEKLFPQGWTYEPIQPKNFFLLIRSPDGLMVTVDFFKRGFRSGYVTTGRMTSTSKYTGRGWKNKLVTAGIKWLDGVRKT